MLTAPTLDKLQQLNLDAMAQAWSGVIYADHFQLRQ